MTYRTLGRTGLRASILGMGTGGHDPLGLASGTSEMESAALLRREFELGVNLFDTAPWIRGRTQRGDPWPGPG